MKSMTGDDYFIWFGWWSFQIEYRLWTVINRTKFLDTTMTSTDEQTFAIVNDSINHLFHTVYPWCSVTLWYQHMNDLSFNLMAILAILNVIYAQFSMECYWYPFGNSPRWRNAKWKFKFCQFNAVSIFFFELQIV